MRASEIRGGMRVVIRKAGDETFPRKYLGRLGVVRAVDLEECGASRHDPFIIVAFNGVGTDGFWREELSPVPRI